MKPQAYPYSNLFRGKENPEKPQGVSDKKNRSSNRLSDQWALLVCSVDLGLKTELSERL